ncbi:MAG: tetratricopeptide repeat protein [Myxococcota bacterium]
MTVHSSGESLDSVLAHLRREEPLESNPARRAVIRHERAVLEERAGATENAVRDYLAACDDDPEFHQPLEALFSLYQRRLAGDEQGLDAGRILETLVDLAHTPEEASRWLRELATFRVTVEDDLAQARISLEQAVEQSPADATSWLELEFIAGREEDGPTRQRALEARSQLTGDATWQGLLLLELAELVEADGNLDQAVRLVEDAVGLGGRATFLAHAKLAHLAGFARDSHLLIRALEAQAELVANALQDAERGRAAGIPATLVSETLVAELWLRSGVLRRRHGDAEGALAVLQAAAERLSTPLVARLTIEAADAAGDPELAVRLAREQLDAGHEGPVGAALWLRLARAAEEQAEFEEARQSYDRALALDPANVVALTLRTDLLAQGEDASLLAAAIEAGAAALSEEAQAREAVTLAYVWAVRAGDVDRGREWLARATELGADAKVVAHVGRSFARLSDDAAWFEEATATLTDSVEEPDELAPLLFELGRARFQRGDAAAAAEAITRRADVDGADATSPRRWLGRALIAYAMPSDDGSKRSPRVRALAEVDPNPALGRGLTLMAALLAIREGDADRGLELLQHEHDADPSDPCTATFLADVLRARGDHSGASTALATAAASSEDPNLAAALELEAGLAKWRAGNRKGAIEAFEQALDYAARAGAPRHRWGRPPADSTPRGARPRAGRCRRAPSPRGGRPP